MEVCSALKVQAKLISVDSTKQMMMLTYKVMTEIKLCDEKGGSQISILRVLKVNKDTPARVAVMVGKLCQQSSSRYQTYNMIRHTTVQQYEK